MSKKILSIIAVLIIIIAVIFMLDKFLLRSAGACSGASFWERSKCNQLNSWLDQKSVEWKPKEYRPMKFGAIFPPLSYGGEMYQDNAEYSDLYLSFLKDLKLDIIRIDLYYDVWLNNDTRHIKTIDEIISHIKEKKYAIMIADASAEQYRGKRMDWNDFRAAYLERVKTLAGRYKPEYYVIVKEAKWYSNNGMLNSQPTADQWADLTKELAKAVKEASPETKVAVGFIPQSEKEYFKKIIDIDEVDIVGFDVYDKDWGLPAASELIAVEKNTGKELWMLETWLDYLPSTGKPWKKELDAKWINASAYYSQNSGLGGYVTFFTKHFFSYGDKQFEGYTPAFNAYKSIIEEVRNNAK